MRRRPWTSSAPGSEPVSAPAVGFAGLGAMGRGMARNLHSAGLLRAVWNRTAARPANWPPKLAWPARRVRRHSREPACDRDLCVAADQDVLQVVDALAPGLRRLARDRLLDGQRRHGARGRRETLATRESISSSARSAAASKARATARSRSWRAALRRHSARAAGAAGNGHARSRISAPSGAGQAAKATNQIMCAGVIQAVAEAMAFAKAQGLPSTQLIETLGKGAGSSWYFVNRAPNIVRDAFPAGFRVRLHEKDLRICHDMAARLGVELPVVETTLDAVPRTDRAGSWRRRYFGAVPPQGRAVRRGGQARDGARLAMRKPPVVSRRQRPIAGFLPAGFLRVTRRPRDRPDCRAARRGARASTPERTRGVLDGPRPDLGVPALDRSSVRCDVVPVAATARAHVAARRHRAGRSAQWSARWRSSRRPCTGSACSGPSGSASRGLLPGFARSIPAAEAADRRDRRGTGVAILLCHASMAALDRARGARTHPCAAGPHPPAFPVQQHEHHRGVDALRSRSRRGSHRRPRRPVPREPQRCACADHAGRGNRDCPHLPAHRAIAAWRPACRSNGTCRPLPAACASCRACCCNRCSRTPSVTGSSRCRTAAPSRCGAGVERDAIVIEVTNPTVAGVSTPGVDARQWHGPRQHPTAARPRVPGPLGRRSGRPGGSLHGAACGSRAAGDESDGVSPAAADVDAS